MIFKKGLALISLCLFSFGSMAAPIDTIIEIKNSNASYVNRGACSIAFDLVAYDFLNNVDHIKFSVIAKNKAGKEILRDELVASDFNMVGGRTYSDIFLEGEEACDAFGETLLITKAIVIYNDGTKPENIIQTKKLKLSDFKPMKIVIPGK